MSPPKLKTNRAQVHETHKVMTIRERLSKGWHDGIHLPLGPERGCTSRGGKLAAKEAHPLLKPSPRLRPPRSPQPTCCWWPPSSYLPLSAGTIFYFFFFFFRLGTIYTPTFCFLPVSRGRLCALAGGHHLSFFFSFPGSCCLSSPWAPSSHSPLTAHKCLVLARAAQETLFERQGPGG